jgi:hypothetical protein
VERLSKHTIHFPSAPIRSIRVHPRIEKHNSCKTRPAAGMLDPWPEILTFGGKVGTASNLVFR